MCEDSWWIGYLSEKGQCKGIYYASTAPNGLNGIAMQWQRSDYEFYDPRLDFYDYKGSGLDYYDYEGSELDYYDLFDYLDDNNQGNPIPAL